MLLTVETVCVGARRGRGKCNITIWFETYEQTGHNEAVCDDNCDRLIGAEAEVKAPKMLCS